LPTTGIDASKLPIVPIDGTHPFLPGQTALTIPLHLNPDFPNTGQISLRVDAVPLNLGSYRVSSPDPSVPTTPRQPSPGATQELTDLQGNPIADQGSSGVFGATA
jgi:hypothetical protein